MLKPEKKTEGDSYSWRPSLTWRKKCDKSCWDLVSVSWSWEILVVSNFHLPSLESILMLLGCLWGQGTLGDQISLVSVQQDFPLLRFHMPKAGSVKISFWQTFVQLKFHSDKLLLGRNFMVVHCIQIGQKFLLTFCTRFEKVHVNVWQYFNDIMYYEKTLSSCTVYSILICFSAEICGQWT